MIWRMARGGSLGVTHRTARTPGKMLAIRRTGEAGKPPTAVEERNAIHERANGLRRMNYCRKRKPAILLRQNTVTGACSSVSWEDFWRFLSACAT
jgi:hypothetical protein